jgi:hypothetical protein
MPEGWVHTLYPDRAMLKAVDEDRDARPLEKYVCDGCGEAFEGDVPISMSGALPGSGSLTFCSWRCAVRHCQQREDERLANVEGPPLTSEERRLYSVS